MPDYTSRDAARLLDLSLAQVRAYARAGFLSPTRGERGEYRFSFQDLVLLRAASGLVAARIPAARIRRALDQLRRQLPGDRSLSELRITAEGDEIVVRDGASVWQPESGQFVLDFQVADLATEIAPLEADDAAAIDPDDERNAEAWYEVGVELESIAPAEALDAYRRAVDLDAGHSDALVNLGRLLHEDGSLPDAEQCYRRALDICPDDGTAAFNLGTVLEDLERSHDAIAAYERAAHLDPTQADAHFNLARLHERLGEKALALQHLKHYKSIIDT
ncbi:MAG: tetratricopeptide repeat protein [Gemmatimonadales bacterium]|jgi:tetratricopeptide (TPR) repeat protein